MQLKLKLFDNSNIIVIHQSDMIDVRLMKHWYENLSVLHY